MRVYQNSRNNQYSISLPKEVCTAMGIKKGDAVKVKVIGSKRLELSFEEAEENE